MVVMLISAGKLFFFKEQQILRASIDIHVAPRFLARRITIIIWNSHMAGNCALFLRQAQDESEYSYFES